jgi:hypothetical protein
MSSANLQSIPVPPLSADRLPMSEQHPRVAPPLIIERWDPPSKPDGASAAIADAYRQTQFQLGSDTRALADGMNLQLQIARDSSASRYRTLGLAATMMYWSRAFLAMSEAAAAISRGAYAVCPVLVRAACEAISAEIQAGGEEQPLFLAWLETAFVPNEEHRGTELGLGNYFAGSTLASAARLGGTFRAAAEFSRQHFGASVLEVAPESNRQRIAPTVGDQSFHFGWAQLTLGWLLSLCCVQLELALVSEGPLHPSDEACQGAAALVKRAESLLSAAGRCRIEEIDENGTRRFLIHNFRRQSSGAPVKMLL